MEDLRERLGPIAGAVERRLSALGESRLPSLLWGKDPAPWAKDSKDRRSVRERLGWLDAPANMRARVDELRAFSEEVRSDGFRQALLLGMGGSSLGAEVLRKVHGVRPGYLDLQVLDSTDPAAVRSAEEALPMDSCLFLVASKSGTTLEVDAFRRYLGSRAGGPEQFVAITDPGTPLARLAEEEGYRCCFLNPPEIGGRFSVLSLYGLVPAALLGVDLDELLDGAADMAAACGSDVPPAESPGFLLGAVLAEAALAGRDKLTLVLPPPLAALGAWIEQLVAESTGKKGRGILPVDGEPLGPPQSYGRDRLFVRTRLPSSRDQALAARVDALAAAEHPTLELDVAERGALGAEFFRWQVATAVASAILGVNAFDQPDVQAAKDQTARQLRSLEQRGRLEEGRPLLEEQGVRIHADPGLRPEAEPARLSDWIEAHLRRVESGDYLALLAYLRRTDRLHYGLEQLRTSLRDRLRIAATIGYGPRFLHSTGQLHAGGPNRGVFFLITHDSAHDVPVPGRPYSFSRLQLAQAGGNFRALVERERRVIRLHLTPRLVSGLETVRAALEEALRRIR